MVFDKLNDDCIVSIFSHLPLTDLIKIERVCTKWRQLSRMTWSMRSDKSLDFRSFLLPGYSSDTINRIVQSVLKRCGQFVTDVTICFENIDYNGDILLIAVPYFGPKLSDIYLICTYVSADGIKMLSENCNGIENICLCEVRGDFENELALLFQTNENLMRFKIEEHNTITGSCLASINNKHLKILEFHNCDLLDIANVEHQAKLIIYLTISNRTETRPRIVNLDLIFTMTNLVSLDLTIFSEQVTDSFMVEIGRHCVSLEFVCLILSIDATSHGLNAIFGLPLLKNLQLIVRKEVKFNEMWSAGRCSIPTLQTLVLFRWDVTDMGICQLIQSSPRLRNLILDTCIQPDERTFDGALTTAIQERESKLKLKFIQQWLGRVTRRITFFHNQIDEAQ